MWRGKRPSTALLLTALISSLFVALPVVYLGLRATQGGVDTWSWLLSHRLPGLMFRTIQLATGTTVLAMAISLPMAWLVMRTDLPGRRLITWLCAMPLVFPPFIGAFVYITIFGPRGTVELLLSLVTGIPGPQLYRPEIYSLTGAIIILAVFTYPYIYLLACSALRGGNRSMEEAAQAAGLSPGQVFWRVTVPLLRPALAAGALLVALYAISDFGSVAMLRVETFTSAIYMQLRGRFDRSAAAALSLVLLSLSMTLVYLEGRIRQQGARYTTTSGQWKPVREVALGPWRLPAVLFSWFVVTVSVVLPTVVLAYWSFQGWVNGEFSLKLFSYASRSLLISAGAALIAGAMALPVAYLAARFPGRFSNLLLRFTYIGYATPGLVVALAVIFFFHTYMNPLYGTVWAMMAAYIIRFMPQAMGATHSGLEALSPSLEDAGLSLGLKPIEVLRKITLPLIAPSLFSGWALVFLNTLKELPATLLLRPAGYDTLAVRVWIEAQDGYYHQAAPAALLLVLIAALPMWIVLRKMVRGQTKLS